MPDKKMKEIGGMMTQFQFSTIFTERRKELKLTQEEVAQFVGVSRAAVSKWEKGLSYPDITLLPKLAMYFDLSIDTLLGYKPQLTKERIHQLYTELAKKFTEQSFEEVVEEIDVLIHEYYSCYPFLMKMAQLYLNYLQLALDVEQVAERIFAICERVKQNADDIQLLQEATAFEATVHIVLKQPEKVIELLGDQPTIEFNYDALIVSALTMLQQPQQAKQIIQVNSYQRLLVLISSLTEVIMLELDNPDYVDETVHRVEILVQQFEVETLNVSALLVFYLRAATAYMLQKRLDRATAMLEKYLKTCLNMKFPLTLSGGTYFYLVQDWMENQQVVMQQAPRDEQSIKNDLLKAISDNPLLQPLLEQQVLRMLFKNVEHYLKGV